MDYEKAYKEALNWMRSIYPTMQGADREDAEHYFPELTESEYEKIRKDCIKYLNWEYQACSINEDKMKIEKCVAWLEKQGEQKSAISDEALHEGIIKFGITQYQIDNWLKKHINVVKQKSAWSEEDERRFKYCKRLVYASDKYSIEDREETVDWIKSIKDRVQPQPKQEWSERDKHILKNIHDFVKENTINPNKVNCAEECLDWLNSIKPNHWKPSKEQIKEVKNAIRVTGTNGTVLLSLYNDLKKL